MVIEGNFTCSRGNFTFPFIKDDMLYNAPIGTTNYTGSSGIAAINNASTTLGIPILSSGIFDMVKGLFYYYYGGNLVPNIAMEFLPNATMEHIDSGNFIDYTFTCNNNVFSGTGRAADYYKGSNSNNDGTRFFMFTNNATPVVNLVSNTNSIWIYVRTIVTPSIFESTLKYIVFAFGYSNDWIMRIRTANSYNIASSSYKNNLERILTTSGKQIYYTPINCALSGPEIASSGDNVSVIVTPNSGHIIKDPTQGVNISIYNKDGYIPFTYNNNQIDFTVP